MVTCNRFYLLSKNTIPCKQTIHVVITGVLVLGRILQNFTTLVTLEFITHTIPQNLLHAAAVTLLVYLQVSSQISFLTVIV